MGCSLLGAIAVVAELIGPELTGASTAGGAARVAGAPLWSLTAEFVSSAAGVPGTGEPLDADPGTVVVEFESDVDEVTEPNGDCCDPCSVSCSEGALPAIGAPSGLLLIVGDGACDGDDGSALTPSSK